MPLMLVIADDLTGAADCGVACAGHGLHTMVAFGDTHDEVDAEAVSIDADTRRLPPDKAASETGRLLRNHLRNQETLLYKKLDSTLRGNIGVELAATLEERRKLAPAHQRIVAVLAPAFPATGRTTVNGHQFVNGLPLEQSKTFLNELHSPNSDIASILRDAQLRPALLGLELVRGSSNTLQREMKTAAQQADVLVCDAESDQDLRAIAEASMTLGRGTVWSGSAGLAWHLPPAAGLARVRSTVPEQPSTSGPTLFVIGSNSSISRQQVETLASRSDTIVLRIPTEVLMAGDQSPQWRVYALELKRALNAGADVAVVSYPSVRLDAALGLQLTAALAAMVQPFARKAGALVATGGETARAIFEAWGVKRLRLIGEVEPGLPFSITSGWNRELPVLTKAGAFGGPETLLHCRQFLRGLEHKESARPDQVKGPQ